MRLILLSSIIPCVLLLSSCSGVYYGAMEKVGFHKRDIMITRVKKARSSEQKAKEVFNSALDEFSAVTGFKGGNLEKQYRRVNKAYLSAEKQAAEVKARHDDVENVSKALFKEWKKEIKQYENVEFKAESSRQLKAAQERYTRLMAAMRRAEKSLDPVLRKFRDHNLFLKHNLNARAIASLEGQVKTTRIEVDRLIREMEAAIAEADTFIKQLEQP
ncbi:DUF2959 domain-containing protein [Verrucomicrobiaceae bacterium 5K15]|uniref:DUF2959 domain-containing protein n=1 Tax=Oceaniferula flava TaxID=2800421 RepID=A0AAE2SBL9_9BACT|nr:DUF2959 domain-containing protein [Oceaniferula flavus]MBK1853944.1 DUF2959 domain-containing protein [Oceaniferula flavus]MBM1135250.1 DUF2959 domain-containing protein [Oceaniferula flavus]